MSSKKKNTITVDFSNAEASEHVTGSMYHVKSGNLELLLDCGLAQSNNLLRDYRANNAHFNFKAKNIKYIFLSHLHLLAQPIHLHFHQPLQWYVFSLVHHIAP